MHLASADSSWLAQRGIETATMVSASEFPLAPTITNISSIPSSLGNYACASVAFFRIVDGKLVEERNITNELDVL